tara:strand:+ start:139 stop:243 length:105 start_codon:yes stop_codon:yes gene_type:complete
MNKPFFLAIGGDTPQSFTNPPQVSSPESFEKSER